MVMMVVMVMVMVVILRHLGICFSLRRLGFVHFFEERKCVGDGIEKLGEGLWLQEFAHIGSAWGGRPRNVESYKRGQNAHCAGQFALHFRFLPDRCPNAPVLAQL